MAKVKIGELIGAALDWAVAKCEGLDPIFTRHYVTPSHIEDPKKICTRANSWVQPFEPSINWLQGGPIIEREHINLRPTFTAGGYRTSQSMDAVNAKIDLPNGATIFDPKNVVQEYGETPLIAAMRCYVASKLGEFTDVPDELLCESNIKLRNSPKRA